MTHAMKAAMLTRPLSIPVRIAPVRRVKQTQHRLSTDPTYWSLIVLGLVIGDDMLQLLMLRTAQRSFHSIQTRTFDGDAFELVLGGV
jgi:hypothetical protein